MNDLKVIENELVPVYETSTGEKVVYGTELHGVLEVKTPYKDWSERRLKDCEAVENEEYEAAQICAPSGQTQKEHIIKLDTAKEMAMLERNEKGKEVRKYFIKIEKKYKELAKPKCIEDVLIESLQEMKALRTKLTEQDSKIADVGARVESIREVVALDVTSWRDETSNILKKIAHELGGGMIYSQIREESYKLFEKRMGYDLKTRLTNRKKTMAIEGASRTKINNTSYLDIIATDKRMIECYVTIVKAMAIRYGVA